MNAIEIHNISKAYGEVKALQEVSFAVQRGELFGLIGPDGAGKTTLFRILTTLLNADSGTAKVDGLDVVNDYKQIRCRVGYMPGRFSLYPDLSVEENMQFFASLFGVTITENYDLVAPIYRQIEPFRTRRAGKLSGGMKQKLALSCALIHRPSVLFLDEPTTGVDAVSRAEFWDMLDNLRQQGISILVSTPYMDEASRCDRIALINNGSIMAIDTPENIVRHNTDRLFTIYAADMFRLLNVARQYPHINEAYAFGDTHHISVEAAFEADAFVAWLSEQGIDNVEIHEAQPTIEDTFIKLMNHANE